MKALYSSVAQVTGADGGIGVACAAALAMAGVVAMNHIITLEKGANGIRSCALSSNEVA